MSPSVDNAVRHDLERTMYMCVYSPTNTQCVSDQTPSHEAPDRSDNHLRNTPSFWPLWTGCTLKDWKKNEREYSDSDQTKMKLGLNLKCYICLKPDVSEQLANTNPMVRSGYAHIMLQGSISVAGAGKIQEHPWWKAAPECTWTQTGTKVHQNNTGAALETCFWMSLSDPTKAQT